MYVIHLWAKMQRGEKLTSEELEMIEGAFFTPGIYREKKSGKLGKKFALATTGLAICLATFVGGEKLISESDKYFQRPEVQAQIQIGKQRMAYLDKINSLEYQAQKALDYSIHTKIAGEEELSEKHMLKAKKFYGAALEISNTSNFSTPGIRERLENNLKSLH